MLVFNHLVKTSLQIYDGVLTGDTEMNENYDIVELALRRYSLYAYTITFPTFNPPPSQHNNLQSGT